MKHRNLILGFALTLGTLGAIGVGTAVGSIGTPNEVGAKNDQTRFEDGDTYKLIGSLAKYSTVEWNRDAGINVSPIAGDETYAFSVDVALTENDEFKFILDKANGEDADGDYVNTTSFAIGDVTYIQGGGDANFKVNVTGSYRFKLVSAIDSYDDVSWGMSIEKINDLPESKVTLYDPEGNVCREVTAANGYTFRVNYFAIDGYSNIKWYTNEERTEEYVPGTIEDDLALYAAGIKATEVHTVYFEGNYNYAHVWTSVGGPGTTWPGLEMAEVSRAWTTDSKVYRLDIPAVYTGVDRILFHDNQGNKTGDSVLTVGTYVYEVGENNTAVVAADSADKLAALEFITEFDTLRKDDGSICYLVNETGHEDALNSIITKYEAIENKALVDSLEDVGGDANIGATMAMLLAKKNSTSGVYGVYSTDPYNTTWIVLMALAGTSVLLGGAFFALKRKKAHK